LEEEEEEAITSWMMSVHRNEIFEGKIIIKERLLLAV